MALTTNADAEDGHIQTQSRESAAHKSIDQILFHRSI